MADVPDNQGLEADIRFPSKRLRYLVRQVAKKNSFEIHTIGPNEIHITFMVHIGGQPIYVPHVYYYCNGQSDEDVANNFSVWWSIIVSKLIASLGYNDD